MVSKPIDNPKKSKQYNFHVDILTCFQDIWTSKVPETEVMYKVSFKGTLFLKNGTHH